MILPGTLLVVVSFASVTDIEVVSTSIFYINLHIVDLMSTFTKISIFRLTEKSKIHVWHGNRDGISVCVCDEERKGEKHWKRDKAGFKLVVIFIVTARYSQATNSHCHIHP